jgi:hypothetical protein
LSADIAAAAGSPSVQSEIVAIYAVLQKQVKFREYAYLQPLYLETLSGREKAGNMLWACIRVAGGEITMPEVAQMIEEVPKAVELANGEILRGFFTLAKARWPWLKEIAHKPWRSGIVSDPTARTIRNPSSG